MINLATPEIWLVCGSQHLYGPGPLQEVAAHAQEIAGALAASSKLPLKTSFKALLTTPDEIARLCLDANSDPNCAGLILWMHTFSPSKMWVRGLNALQKPFVCTNTIRISYGLSVHIGEGSAEEAFEILRRICWPSGAPPTPLQIERAQVGRSKIEFTV